MLKKDVSKFKKVLITFLFILLECFFIALLFLFSDKFLYSSYNKDLIVIILTALVCILFSFIGGKKLFVVWERSFAKYLLIFLSIISCGGCFLHIGKCIYAFRYENSDEVYRLSNNMSVAEAKKTKNTIDSIFEKDFDDVFSRNVIIDNYYYDEERDEYVLYLADYYKNFKLKFYVEMDDFKVVSIYWEYNDDVLYFVYNGEKTNNFEFYYAMYILNEVIGENTDGVVTLEDAIETKLKKHFVDSTNVIISYENLSYSEKENVFILNCHVAAMDFADDVLEEDFEVLFSGISEKDRKKVWYYGDSSFDFVNYDINI